MQVDREALKSMVQEIILELIHSDRKLLMEIVEELEDYALLQAIKERKDSENVEEEIIFEILDRNKKMKILSPCLGLFLGEIDMNVSFKKSFQKELKEINDRAILEKIKALIADLKGAANLPELSG